MSNCFIRRPVFRIYITLTIFQSYRNLEAGDTKYLNQVAIANFKSQTACSTSQEPLHLHRPNEQILLAGSRAEISQHYRKCQLLLGYQPCGVSVEEYTPGKQAIRVQVTNDVL